MNSSAVATFHFYFDAALYRCIEIFCEWCEFPPENFIVKQNNEKEKEKNEACIFCADWGLETTTFELLFHTKNMENT